MEIYFVNDQSNKSYDIRNWIIYNTEVLKSNLYDYNVAYILVRDDISIKGGNEYQVSFKNCVPFIKSITQIDGATTDDVERLDLVMSMYQHMYMYICIYMQYM